MILLAKFPWAKVEAHSVGKDQFVWKSEPAFSSNISLGRKPAGLGQTDLCGGLGVGTGVPLSSRTGALSSPPPYSAPQLHPPVQALAPRPPAPTPGWATSGYQAHQTPLPVYKRTPGLAFCANKPGGCFDAAWDNAFTGGYHLIELALLPGRQL
jgi:hypothetical protein